MSEVVRGSSAGGADAREAAEPSTQTACGSQPGGKTDSPSAAAENEQFKYHQQMLYPTPGLRNYGFSDAFMMHTFKVEPCRQQEKHARGSCPYAHPGDVAQRRHPDAYQALLCPEVRAKKVCPRGNDCQCSHSAFEFWLHPDRYRTSMCEKGERCSRPVCFFAHNEKELRALPGGLKPAVQTPEETAKRQGSSRSGSITGALHSPRDFGGTMAPGALPAQGVHAMYMQGLGLHGRPVLHPRSPLPMMAQGYLPAGYNQTQPGYRPQQSPPALDLAMQAGYGAVAGGQYLPQSPMLSPGGAGELASQSMAGSPMLLAGAAAAGAAQQFSPVAPGRTSNSGNSGAAGIWQQQQQGPVPQARPAHVAAPAAGGMQLPESVLQQFQQLGVGNAHTISPTYGAANNSGMMAHMQLPGSPYAQQQGMYMQAGPEQGWAQQPLPLQHHQQRQAQLQYGGGMSQYGVPGLEPQRTMQGMQPPQQHMHAGVMMGRLGPACMAPQQAVAAGGAFGMPAEAQAGLMQSWGPGVIPGLGPQDPSTALVAGMVPPAQPSAGAGAHASFDGQGGW